VNAGMLVELVALWLLSGIMIIYFMPQGKINIYHFDSSTKFHPEVMRIFSENFMKLFFPKVRGRIYRI